MSFNETRFLLSERNNPNSAVRANGFRWWGYPSRNGAITAIVLHTTENSPGPGVAMNVARWQASTAPSPSSYHKLVDTRDIVQTVLDNHTAFHAVGFNARGLGLSFATRASSWGNNKATDRAMLERGAQVAAQWAIKYDIPVRWITKAQGERGVKGFITHAAVDPSRRSDPGKNFPAAEFFRLVNAYISAQNPADEWEVFWMALDNKTREFLTRMAEQAEREGLDGQSFVRQFMIMHRDERPIVQDIARHVKEKGSSVQGFVRGSINLFRHARDEAKWPVNTN